MGLPDNWTLVPVRGTFLDLHGNSCRGSVVFSSDQVVTVDGRVVVPRLIIGTLDETGAVSVLLPSTTDPDTAPTGWVYTVIEHIHPAGRPPYRLAVPHDAGEINLDTAPIAPPVDPVDPTPYVGPRGWSAYQIAVDEGYTGSEAEWLASLVGPEGPQGPDGPAAPLSDTQPAPLGTVAPGVSTEASRSDHVHPMPTAAQVGADISGAASSAIAAHEAELDPHPQYTTWGDAGAAAPVQSVAGRTGYVTLTTTDIGGLGTAATANTADFATAAQGATAESALQPADGLAALDSAAATKLTGIATGATANATDAQLRDRATHTGTQPSTTITGLGDAATRDVGTTAGTVAAGDDARLSDARTPTAHQHPSTGISDSTATGRAVLTAADAATARTAIGAPSSAQLAGVQATAEAALPKAGGTMTGPLAIETPTVQPLRVSANLPVPGVPTPVVIGPNNYVLLGVAGGGGPYLSGTPYVWLGHPEQAKGKVHCSFGYSGAPVMSVTGPNTSSPDPLSQVIFRVGYGRSDAAANAFEALTPLNALSAVITNGGHLRTLSNITPMTDISASCGDASRRWTQVHAQDGTIQTSDARLKSAVEPLSPALIAIGLQCARETGRFRWLARIAEVGEAARWHIGLTAQRVAEIFALHGEDAYAYGIVCYDTWPERVEIVTPAEYEQRDTGTLDEHDMPVYETIETTPAVTRTIPAGDAYSLRYDELSRLIAAAMIARQDALEARIAALESAT